MLLVCSGGVAMAQEISAGEPRATGALAERKTVDSSASSPFAAGPAMVEMPGANKKHPYELQPGEDPQNELGFPLLKHFASDQENFWTAPMHVHRNDLRWIAPAAGFTAALIASDSWIANQVPDKPNQLLRSQHISNYAVYSLIGLDGGSFLLGHITGNDHLAETGLLGGEAALNSTAVAYLLNYATQRPRPIEGNGHGSFLQGGSSFPSEHSTVAWSIASVVAHEYPGPLTQFAAYGLATAVTLTRITSKQHFASDAVIGSALGWYFGRQAYRAHHDPEVGGGSWGDLQLNGETPRARPENMGSPYVPLDSWIYPAFERLAALGYVDSAYLGQRPWTRLECAQFLEEAGEHLRYDGEPDGGAGQIYQTLESEFQDEIRGLDGAANARAQIDSIYIRATSIAGPALRDSFNFGQTIANDFGRPYAQGVNSVDGATAHAVAGPFYMEIQGEYQHAPAVASYSQSVLQAIANTNDTLPLPNGRGTLNRFDLLTGSVGLTFHNLQVSFGKQSLWMGPGESGALLMSDNAEPIPMLRIASASPVHIPLLSDLLGPAQSEFFLGQLSGHHWELNYPNLVGPNISPQPFIHGDKISFKPTPNFEFGMGVTAMFGGPGLPFTWDNFLRTYYVHTPNARTNPGKRISSADFSYRVPGLRNWLTIYADSLVVDEISPLGSTRATVNPGIYLPQIPKLPHLEFRAEGVHEPITQEFGPGFVYTDTRRFRDGYTNDGQLMGSWIGRAGRGGQGWLTYFFSPLTKLQLMYRNQQVAEGYNGGGHMTDYALMGELRVSPQFTFSGWLQYEQWSFPLLATTRQSNVAASLQLAFRPHRGNSN